MEKTKRFKFNVFNTLCKQVIVDAKDEDEARDKIETMYENGEIKLTMDDVLEWQTEFYSEGECKQRED